MHWLSLLALTATSAVGSNAFESSIFTFHADQDSLTPSSGSETVSEDVARLILELRMRSPLHSKLGGNADPEVVGYLNEHADSQYSLFGGEASAASKDGLSRSVIFLEGLDDQIVSSLRKSQDHSIFVPHTSSEMVNDALEPLVNMDSSKHCIYSKDGESQNSQSIKECLAKNPILSHDTDLFDQDLLALANSVETSMTKNSKLTTSRLVFEKKSIKPAHIKSLESTFNTLSKKASSSNTEITIVTLPTIDNLAPRQRSEKRSTPAVSDYESDYQSRASSDSEFIHSNLAPVCHATNSSCSESTNNCSGHGSCYLKYGTGNEGATGNCYACRCKQTTVKQSDGSVKKISWGGVACQKEDISSPFFLIAGVTILVIALAGSAVGMLFSMGNEGLPSVIAAGVGGPKNQS